MGSKKWLRGDKLIDGVKMRFIVYGVENATKPILLLTLLKLTVWGTWGPIVESTLVAFPGWGPNTAASFSNWPPLIQLLFMLPLGSFAQRIGKTWCGFLVFTVAVVSM